MTEIAFKTTDPEIVAAWKRVVETRSAAVARALAEAESIGKNKGFMVQRSLGDEEFTGLAPIDPEDPPEGWRFVRNQFEPRRGKAGDDARAWLKSVQLPNLRNVMHEHGMPKVVFANHRMMTPGLLLHNDTIWANFSQDIGDREVGPAWERCRLSEYYAAQEAADEAAQVTA